MSKRAIFAKNKSYLIAVSGGGMDDLPCSESF